MSKPDWGIKRTCQGCGARFYDLNRTPIMCPKCGTKNDPASPTKQRRQAAVKPVESVRPPIPVPDLEVAVAEEAPEAIVAADDEEEDAVIEDTSDLGEDEDDVAEVKEHLEDEGGR